MTVEYEIAGRVEFQQIQESEHGGISYAILKRKIRNKTLMAASIDKMDGFCRLSATKPKVESSPSNAVWIVVKECVVFIVRCHTKNSGTASAQKT